MRFPTPLLRGHLVKRYKRFLADVVLDTGATVTATCPNTGSMRGLTDPGSIVWLSVSDSATRKYPHTWEMVESTLSGRPVLVGINTARPNAIVSEAIPLGSIAELTGYPGLRREVRYGVNSRIDILLECAERGTCYVEIKNVHLMRTAGLAEFPDSVTERGAKHLRELADMVAAGHRAAMIFLVQRGDASEFQLAADIDPGYAAAFTQAVAAGVEMLAYRCALTVDGITVDQRLPIIPPMPAAPSKATKRPVRKAPGSRRTRA
jgi:sugar fermentation stimulation protein A